MEDDSLRQAETPNGERKLESIEELRARVAKAKANRANAAGRAVNAEAVARAHKRLRELTQQVRKMRQ